MPIVRSVCTPVVSSRGPNPRVSPKTRSGLVLSPASPGPAATSVEVGTKRLELLRELVPGAVKVAVLVDPATPVTETTLREVEMAARSMGAARGAGAAAGDAGDRVSHARIGRLVVTPCGH